MSNFIKVFLGLTVGVFITALYYEEYAKPKAVSLALQKAELIGLHSDTQNKIRQSFIDGSIQRRILAADADEKNRTVWQEHNMLMMYMRENCPNHKQNSNFFCWEVMFQSTYNLVEFCKELLSDKLTNDVDISNPECQTLTMKQYDKWFVKSAKKLDQSLAKPE